MTAAAAEWRPSLATTDAAVPSSVRRTGWTATDLLAATFPEPRWAVPGLVAEGLSLLVGSPKLGKSWLALNLCLAVASGGHALGQIPLERGEAAYLALEDPPRRLQRRLQSVLQGEPAPAGLFFETAWPTLAHGGAELLSERLERHPGLRLVVVDVLAKIRGSVTDRGSLYSADYAAITSLKDVADRHEVALLLLHHDRKAGSDDFVDVVSGTSGIAGAADAIILMSRARNSAEAKLSVTGRDVEESEYALRFDAQIGTWTMLDGPASDYELTNERRQILEAVRAGEGAGPKAIADVTGLSYGVVKHLVRKMADARQLDSDGDGHYFPPLSPVHPVHRVHQDAGDGPLPTLSPIHRVHQDDGDGERGERGEQFYREDAE